MLKQPLARNQVHNLKSQQGLSLLEVMLSIAVVAISVTALVIISNAAISSVKDSRDQAIADQYTRQALEATRVNRDQVGWNTFLLQGATVQVGQYWMYKLTDVRLNTTSPAPYQWTSSEITANNPCQIMSNQGLSNYAIPSATGYYRSVILNRTSTSEVKVTANVCYNYNGTKSRKVSVDTILTDWK